MFLTCPTFEPGHLIALLTALSYLLTNRQARLALLVDQRTAALRESEERYRAVAGDMPVLICRFLPEGEIIYVNEAYCKYFTKMSEEVVGQTFLSLIPESDRETVMANISALLTFSEMKKLKFFFTSQQPLSILLHQPSSTRVSQI